MLQIMKKSLGRNEEYEEYEEYEEGTINKTDSLNEQLLDDDENSFLFSEKSSHNIDDDLKT